MPQQIEEAYSRRATAQFLVAALTVRNLQKQPMELGVVGDILAGRMI